MRTLGLQARILLLATAGVAAIFLLDFFIEAYVQVGNAKTRMAEQSRSVGAALVPTLQNDLIVGDLATAQQTLDSILKHDHFSRLAILDAAGARVLVEGRSGGGEPSAPAWFTALLDIRPAPMEMPIEAGGIRYGVLIAESSPAVLLDDLWRHFA